MAYDNILFEGGNSISSLSHGVIQGGQLSINVVTSKFDISDGRGVIVDAYTNPLVPTAYPIIWSGLTAITVTNIATSTVTFVYLQHNGSGGVNVIQTTVTPTEITRRDYIYLGQLGHADNIAISNALPQPDVFQSPISQLRDLFSEIKYINSGNTITANGANLSLNKGTGALTGLGVGFFTNIKSPNKISLSAQTLATLRLRTQIGGSGTVTVLNPTKYDNAGTLTTVPANNNAQNLRVYLLTTGNLIVQYGQQVYSDLTSAIQGVSSESFVEFSNVKQGQLIAIISVTKTCTSLQDTTKSKITNLGKFGDISASSGGGSTSINQAYLNSSDGRITTDATRGAVKVKRGSGADTDNIYQGENGAGTTTFSVKGNGAVAGLNFNGVALTNGGGGTLFLNDAGNYVSAGGGSSYLKATSSIVEASWSGNQWYTKAITVAGAVVGQAVQVSLSNTLLAGLASNSYDIAVEGAVTSANTVTVYARSSGFQSIPVSSNWYVVVFP